MERDLGKRAHTDYWTEKHFFDSLYDDCLKRTWFTFPFAQFKEVQIKYKLKPKMIEYKSTEDELVVVTANAKQSQLERNPLPTHGEGLPDVESKTQYYEAVFVVTMTVKVDTTEAVKKQILYRDDLLTQRVKDIMSSRMYDRSPMAAAGALMIAAAAYEKDRYFTSGNDRWTQSPPYPSIKEPMENAMDAQTYKDFKTLDTLETFTEIVEKLEKLRRKNPGFHSELFEVVIENTRDKPDQKQTKKETTTPGESKMSNRLGPPVERKFNHTKPSRPSLSTGRGRYTTTRGRRTPTPRRNPTPRRMSERSVDQNEVIKKKKTNRSKNN
jgi:hypothetical protein